MAPTKTFRCEIVSAESALFSDDAVFLVAPGQMGELGITPRHAPLLTLLKPGKASVTLPTGSTLDFVVSGGILEVQPHTVTILTDSAIRTKDIDEVAAKAAKEEAERALAGDLPDIDLDAMQAQLALSMAQLSALARLRKQGAILNE